MAAKAHRNIRVAGDVQGVLFRRAAKEKADELGITGFVRNERDGSVHIEAEGKPAMLELFIRWCWEGSRQAAVKGVEEAPGPLKNYSEFLIL